MCASIRHRGESVQYKQSHIHDYNTMNAAILHVAPAANVNHALSWHTPLQTQSLLRCRVRIQSLQKELNPFIFNKTLADTDTLTRRFYSQMFIFWLDSILPDIFTWTVTWKSTRLYCSTATIETSSKTKCHTTTKQSHDTIERSSKSATITPFCTQSIEWNIEQPPTAATTESDFGTILFYRHACTICRRIGTTRTKQAIARTKWCGWWAKQTRGKNHSTILIKRSFFMLHLHYVFE